MVVTPGPQASSTSSQSDATRPTADALPRTACPDWLPGRKMAIGSDHSLGQTHPGQDSNGDWPVPAGELAFHWSSLWAGSGDQVLFWKLRAGASWATAEGRDWKTVEAPVVHP